MTGPTTGDREVNPLAGLVSQSGNVSCMIDADLARCDIIDRDWSPTRSARRLRVGLRASDLSASGESAQLMCAGDTAFGADEVLPYGESITAGLLRCESAESCITCRDVRTSDGFSISRQAYQLF
ncbi:MAG: hypothetical protein QOF66_1320 [Mycobacterium sp.]|nr:hypothetical protein [Mycobacterium sp.]